MNYEYVYEEMKSKRENKRNRERMKATEYTNQ